MMIASNPSLAGEAKWVKAVDTLCSQACASERMFPVGGGKFQGSKADYYYVCLADMQGLRPGYQLPSSKFGKACSVGHNGQEKGVQTQMCLCSSDGFTAD
jgi:hypothetical protein